MKMGYSAGKGIGKDPNRSIQNPISIDVSSIGISLFFHILFADFLF
jgi:hypothetical protein